MGKESVKPKAEDHYALEFMVGRKMGKVVFVLLGGVFQKWTIGHQEKGEGRESSDKNKKKKLPKRPCASTPSGAFGIKRPKERFSVERKGGEIVTLQREEWNGKEGSAHKRKSY